MRERQVGLRRHQEIEQRAQIQRLERRQQAAAARAQVRHAGIAQGPLVVGQVALAAHEQLEIAPAHGALVAVLAHAFAGMQRTQAGGDLAAFVVALRIASLLARLGQRIARRGFAGLRDLRHRHERQQQRLAGGGIDGGALLGVDGIVAPRTRLQEDGVDPLQHGRRVAARAIGAQHGGIEPGDEHVARGLEQARIGAAETVDRLLRVAHQEHRRPHARALVTAQPPLQDAPLHRVGVLEFVEQQVLVARVQPHLQVGGGVFVAHQAGGFPLEVGEVHRARLALVGLVPLDQRIAEGEQRGVDGTHAALVAARVVSGQGLAQRAVQVDQRLRAAFADGLDQRLGRFACTRLAGLRMERGEQHLERIAARSRIRQVERARRRHCRFDLHRTLALRRAALPQPARHAQHVGKQRGVLQRLDQRIGMGVVAEQVIERAQRVGARLRLVGPPVAALREHRVEQAAGLEIADQVDERVVGGTQFGMFFGQQAAPERRPGFAAQAARVFAQRGPLRHARRQRRPAQQAAEPAVERIDRHARRRLQHPRVQPARRGNQPRRIAFVDGAGNQFAHHCRVVSAGQLGEDIEQALAHLFGRLAREGDGKNVRGRRPHEQQPQHARHQQPGLAAAGAGLHHHRALRVACGTRKRLGRDRRAVALISVVAHGCPSVSGCGSRGAPAVQ